MTHHTLFGGQCNCDRCESQARFETKAYLIALPVIAAVVFVAWVVWGRR